MKKLSLPASAILIAIAFIVQPVAFCVAQNWDIANAMRGHHLHNQIGEDLGRIECVTPGDFGQPEFMVVSVTSSKIVTIPFSALLYPAGVNKYVVNISRYRLRNSPGYSINVADSFCGLQG
jgi:hypothetical protein